MRNACLLLAAATMVGAASPIVIADKTGVSPADRAAVSAIEVQLFADIKLNGTIVAFDKIIPGGVPASARADLSKLDELCGKIVSAQRSESRTLGSLYIRDTVAAVHTNCLIDWDLTYAKEHGAWSLRHFDFNTPNDDW